MSRRAVHRFLWMAGGIAAVSGAVVALTVGTVAGRPGLGWSLLGWGSMAAVGIAGGAWAVARHGSVGSGFLVAMGICILARLVFAGAGAVAAATRGRGAMYAYLAGLGAGYLPVQLFEMGWFLRGRGARP